MPVRKTPAADLRRRYPLYAEAGLALALGASILAFTLPAGPPENILVPEPTDDPIRLVSVVPPTTQPPPPPPPAPPPPVEVPDDVTAEEVIEAVDLEVTDVPIPPMPPAPDTAPAPRPPEPSVHLDPPAPPPLPEDQPDRVFDIVQQEPQLIGGLDGLQALVEYPEMARRVGLEGRVIVRFVVDETGAVTDPEVVRSPGEALSAAALAAVRQVRFTPGQQRGRPVKVRVSVPVTFRLR